MADSASVLRSFLQGHKLHSEVIAYILEDSAKGLGCESVGDYAGYWAQSDCDFTSTVLTHVGQFKDGTSAARIQLSRLRVAWQHAILESSKTPTVQPTDPDLPLSTEEAAVQQNAWTAV